MPLDTVKLRSPTLDENAFSAIEQACVRRQGIQVASGAVLYEMTSGGLQGSWDSRVSLRPMQQDWIADSNGRVRLQPCPPYVLVECSAAKVLCGQNVYGGPTNFPVTCERLLQGIGNLFGIHLPEARRWHVRRADWAESFALPYIGIQEYFEVLQTTYFPRRKMQKFGDHSIYVPGHTTTLKLYHKGPEFKGNDAKRIRQALTSQSPGNETSALSFEQRQKRAQRKVHALQRLANRRLRVEVEIHANKLDFDFGHKPRVEEVTDEYLMRTFDYEIDRLLREGQTGLGLARTNRDVAARLKERYGRTVGHRLHGFWCVLAASGEAFCKREYASATFYRCRKALMDAGVSWHIADVQIAGVPTALPSDFAPVRFDPRRCESTIRNRSSLFQLQHHHSPGHFYHT